MLTVQRFDASRPADLDTLFSSDPVVDRCWCMWFITRVAEFHEAGRAGNRAAFLELAQEEEDPVGLVAYRDAEPVGWCAAGPRRRYARVLRAPTLKQRDRTEDNSVWLVPCFFIRQGVRHEGVATALLAAAVDLARERGAPAIEGFPLAGTKTRSGGSDFMTGVEAIFAAAGFLPVQRPSTNRVIMRLELN
jgi:GNAT superfamily N-acetyltransferase